jgi:hypothetical protein
VKILNKLQPKVVWFIKWKKPGMEGS